MKVFKMNDLDWVCAENEKQAKEYYKKECGLEDDLQEEFVEEVSLSNTMFVDIDELPESEKKQFQVGMPFRDTILIYKTFEWVIQHDNITSPCIIASTEE